MERPPWLGWAGEFAQRLAGMDEGRRGLGGLAGMGEAAKDGLGEDGLGL